MARVVLGDDVDEGLLADYEAVTDAYRRSAPRRFMHRWRCERDDCDGLPHDGWSTRHARSAQVIPSAWTYEVVDPESGEVLERGVSDRVAYACGGRGSGKTWAGAHNFAQLVLETEPVTGDERTEWAVIAPTYRHARRVCIEGPSGLITAFGGFVRHGGLVEKWNRSVGELVLTTGAVIYIDGATDGAERIQGENLYGCWAEEAGLWKAWERAWHESLSFAVRRGPARIIVTGTPKRSSLAKYLLDDPKVWRRRLRTLDNAANLAKSAVDDLLARYGGTRLGQQELEGLLVDDADGALWTRAVIDRYRVTTHTRCGEACGFGPDTVHWHRVNGTPMRPARAWHRVVVGLDPADGTDDGDEQGLVVVGHSATDHELYVLESDGLRLSPFEFLSHAVERAAAYGPRASITVEKNHGGRYLVGLLDQVFMAKGLRVPVHVVTAQRGKKTRAEEVSGMWERGVVHHVDAHSVLEDEMSTWTGVGREPSPDRMDALVWAASEWAGMRLGPPTKDAGHVARWTSDTPATTERQLVPMHW